MARNAKKKMEDELPEGFEPIASNLDGWFTVEEGNSVQGIMRDSFIVEGKFGPKRVYKIEITAGTTRIVDSESNETEAAEGMTIGVDEKGWLKSLSQVAVGREVFVKCLGKDTKPGKKGQQAAWLFKVAAK